MRRSLVVIDRHEVRPDRLRLQRAALALREVKASREIDTGLANDPALQAQMMHPMAVPYSGFFSEPSLWRNGRFRAPEWIASDPDLKSLHDAPRFDALIAKARQAGK